MSELEAIAWCRENYASIRWISHLGDRVVCLTVWDKLGCPSSVYAPTMLEAVMRFRDIIEIRDEVDS